MNEPPKTDDASKQALTYEETPIIDPSHDTLAHESAGSDTDNRAESLIPEAAKVFSPSAVSTPPTDTALIADTKPDMQPPQPVRNAPKKSRLGTLLFVIILFGLGVWLSGQIRSLFSAPAGVETQVPTAPTGAENPSGGQATGSAAVKDSAWSSYALVSGASKQPIPGASYYLPATVKPPVCDNEGCSSWGTNLPGGTRLTIAPRGKGQPLPDFRGAILTDATGREFVMKQTAIGGKDVYEYTGNFTGRTGGGYSFTKMHGVLIMINDAVGVDINHFSPTGTDSDYDADDALFTEIISRITVSGTGN